MLTKSDITIRKIQLRNAGDWNGEQAVIAYREGDEDRFARLIAQADRLWQRAEAV